MRKLILFAVAFIAVVPVFSGCELFSLTETAEFSLETEYAGVLGEARALDVFCVSSPDLEQYVRVDGGCRSMSFSVPRNYVSAVLAYPVVEGFRQRPVGTVYPCSCRLDVTGGFVAEVLARIYRLSEDGAVQDYVTRFNWQRLYDECAEFEDPWALDMDRIVKSIAKGSFRKSDLKLAG